MGCGVGDPPNAKTIKKKKNYNQIRPLCDKKIIEREKASKIVNL
jgi:hypothetical protein